MTTGYAHPIYAESLCEFGMPRQLPRCGGWILERPIEGASRHDAMGCYPLFACTDWQRIHEDLEEIGQGLISLALVTDPFGECDPASLSRCFDVVYPFKEHYVADLSLPVQEIAGRRHRKHGRCALRRLEMRVSKEPAEFMEEWMSLYGNLIERHNVSGIQAFSKRAFAGQMSIPGTSMLRARHEGVTVGASIYFQKGDVVYCHLAAVSPVGYELCAFHAMDLYSIEYFSDKARWLDFGGAAGVGNGGEDGLSLYKKGWSNMTRTAYFCGRIFNRKAYDEILKLKGIAENGYFPAYRKGEFR